MMKRVCSRQRLVSWDAFEANGQPRGAEEDASGSDSDGAPPPPPCSSDCNTILEAMGHEQLFLAELASADSSQQNDALVSLSLKRKRQAKTLLAPPANALCHGSKKETNAFPPNILDMTTSERCTEARSKTMLCNINDDVKLHILSFLNAKDVRQMMQASKGGFYKLISSDEASLLWKHLIAKQWSYCVGDEDATKKLEFVSAVTTNADTKTENEYEHGNGGGYRGLPLDYNALLHAGSTTYPSKVDVSIFAPCRWSRSLRRYRWRRVSSRTELKTVRWINLVTNKEETAVQFIGEVGSGDRCIRSDQPFVAPKQENEYETNELNMETQGKCGGALARFLFSSNGRNQSTQPMSLQQPPHSSFRRSFNLVQRLRRSRALSSANRFGNNRMLSTIESEDMHHEQELQAEQHQQPEVPLPLRWEPFVLPFRVMSKDVGTSSIQTMSLTPRLINYYEVSILPPPATIEIRPSTRNLGSIGNGMDDHNFMNSRFGTDCVAVGLSTNDFSLHTRMVGWDSYSYGYHGDDGGVFHDTGHMLREYGPRFGAGDTVGCGIDYHRNVIFFTLNGRFLGDAFHNLDASADESENGLCFFEQDWYPTVGIDTKCLVQCNFGTNRPFVFDLEAFMKENHADVQQHVREKEQANHAARLKLS